MSDYAKGLAGIIAAETQISFIDGQKGILEYVGIPIGELASRSSFEETVFLLWNKRLPTADELAIFNAEFKSHEALPAGMDNRLLALAINQSVAYVSLCHTFRFMLVMFAAPIAFKALRLRPIGHDS